MGWMKALRNDSDNPKLERVPSPPSVGAKREAEGKEIIHIENISTTAATTFGTSPSLTFISPKTPNSELPFLSAAAVSTIPHSHLQAPLYLVIDNIVYDCTQFVHEHPGGQQVIQSFRGQDCSWQFWRFHTQDAMRNWGTPLRVARTEGLKNRWKERPRFVGLRRLEEMGENEW